MKKPTQEQIDQAIKCCKAHIKHTERMKSDTKILAQAASMARSGNKIQARRLKSQVDAQPRMGSGANFTDNMDAILAALTAYKQTEDNKRLRKALEFIASGCLVPPDGGSPTLEDAVERAQQALEGRDEN